MPHDFCRRCAGLLVSETYLEMQDGTYLSQWYCLSCGCRTDEVIEANLHTQPVGATMGRKDARSYAPIRMRPIHE